MTHGETDDFVITGQLNMLRIWFSYQNTRKQDSKLEQTLDGVLRLHASLQLHDSDPLNIAFDAEYMQTKFRTTACE